MNEEILNKVYSASLEFGENFHKPIIDIVAELYPYIPDDEKTAIADYIGQTRDAIENFFMTNTITKTKQRIKSYNIKASSGSKTNIVG